MHPLAVQVIQALGQSAVEYTVKALVGAIFDPRNPSPADPPTDPTHEGIDAMNEFLRALAHHDMPRFFALCDPHWVRRPEISQFIRDTLAAAPPVSWSFEEVYVPSDWHPAHPLPWVMAELPVTFQSDAGWEDVPTVLRAVQNNGGWQIDHLEWYHQPEPDPPAESLADIAFPFDFPIFVEADASPAPERVILDCPRCSRKLRVPGDKGRLRVTCPGCKNVQWYTP